MNPLQKNVENPARDIEISNVPSIVNESSSLMEVISRAASDSSIDVEKLERLLGMYERVRADRAKSSYFTALSEMQQKLPVIERRGDGGGRYKYALWEDINAAILPVLSTYGFAISFRIGQSDKNISVTGVLSHSDGHSEETTMQLPTDVSGNKNPVHAVGSAASYGKRYTASALLNLTTRAEDDDGATASRPHADGMDESTRAYLAIATKHIQKIEEVSALKAWWEKEQSDRTRHDLVNGRPGFVELFNAYKAKGLELSRRPKHDADGVIV